MKHTRQIGWILAVGILSTALFPSVFPANRFVEAKAETDAADRYFLNFVSEDTDNAGEISYTHTPLYDEELQINGRQYDFTVGEVSGYALLAEIENGDQTFYEIEELFYNKTSPFDECEGLPVYITHGLYLDYKDNAFYNLSDDSAVSEEFIEEQAYQGFGYSGTVTFTDTMETISYRTKNTTSYSIQYDLPNFFASFENSSCANTAGAILIAYYDRFYENLIPNYTPYTQFGSIIKYKGSGTEIESVVSALYTSMGTNVDGAGTTYTGFQNGMAEYVSDHGYTYSTTSVFSWGSFDFSKYQAAVQVGQPVALFMSGYTMLDGIVEGEGVDTIYGGHAESSHILVGCGYKTDVYYDANGYQTAFRRYLKVASGLASYNIGYLNISAAGTMDRAVAVAIS